MAFTKTSVITLATKEDADLINELKKNDQVAVVLGNKQPDITMDGDKMVIKRNWVSESTASAWVQYMIKLADKAGVSLAATEIIDYTE